MKAGCGTGRLYSTGRGPNAWPNPSDGGAGLTAMMADVDEVGVGAVEKVEVVVAHDERATLRVGTVYVKVDSDQSRLDDEVEAMVLAPGPDTAGPLAEPACPCPGRPPRSSAGPSREAVDRVVNGMGCCRRRGPEAA